jgi:dipeptidyl aminopeptidase/acylaminoacyl peptidase
MTTSDTMPDETPRHSDSLLIPREVLFGDPDLINPQLSPDGNLLAYAAPHVGAMNVWIQPADRSAPARPVTADRGRGITTFTLCAGDRLIYNQDADGDENHRLYLLDLPSGRPRLVTPEWGVQARILAYQPAWHPDRMLITANAADPHLHDVHELDLLTGVLTKIESNPGHTAGEPPFVAWLIDADLRVRGGAAPTPDGGVTLYIRDGEQTSYRELIVMPGDEFSPATDVFFTRDGMGLIMATSLQAPATRLARIDVRTGQLTTISGDPDYDLSGVWRDAETLEPLVAAEIIERASDLTQTIIAADPADKADLYRQLGLKLTYHHKKQPSCWPTVAMPSSRSTTGGSSGYGKAHMNAGNGQWGRAMHDDLLDAVQHLSEEGVIDPDRVGIYGGSYGGYAALCGAVFNSDVFRCAVAACGPSDLATLISSFPAYAQPMIALWHTRVGHPERDADKLREVSPLTYAADIRTPLLLAQGANDPPVRKEQADQLIAALKQNGIDHEYLVSDDEGHGLVLTDNRETFYAAVENFLATHLGGVSEQTNG